LTLSAVDSAKRPSRVLVAAASSAYVFVTAMTEPTAGLLVYVSATVAIAAVGAVVVLIRYLLSKRK
jgi:NADPH-dependent curcumin reductase CurA